MGADGGCRAQGGKRGVAPARELGLAAAELWPSLYNVALLQLRM